MSPFVHVCACICIHIIPRLEYMKCFHACVCRSDSHASHTYPSRVPLMMCISDTRTTQLWTYGNKALTSMGRGGEGTPYMFMTAERGYFFYNADFLRISCDIIHQLFV